MGWNKSFCDGFRSLIVPIRRKDKGPKNKACFVSRVNGSNNIKKPPSDKDKAQERIFLRFLGVHNSNNKWIKRVRRRIKSSNISRTARIRREIIEDKS